MSSRFRHVALVGKHHSLGIGPVLDDIGRFLLRRGLDVTIEQETALNAGLSDYPSLPVDALGSECDLVIVLGGDGTMLGIARTLAAHGTPLIGINQGRLGFITDVRLEEFAGVLGPIVDGDFVEELRTMLIGSVWRDDHSIYDGHALNDVVVSRGSSASMVELKIDIGPEFVAHVRADGLIVASPTGSTAYALSAGGPIVHPAVDALVMMPIAPHDLSHRPIVLNDDAEINIEIIAARDASVSFDNQNLASLLRGDTIHVRRSAHNARFLHPVGWSYYATLRRKLHWNAGSA